MSQEKKLRAAIPRWTKNREMREADFLPPAERRAFYDNIRREQRQKQADATCDDAKSPLGAGDT